MAVWTGQALRTPPIFSACIERIALDVKPFRGKATWRIGAKLRISSLRVSFAANPERVFGRILMPAVGAYYPT